MPAGSRSATTSRCGSSPTTAPGRSSRPHRKSPDRPGTAPPGWDRDGGYVAPVPAARLGDSLRRRGHQLVAESLRAAWAWAGSAGAIGPDDARGRRFAQMGAGSCVAFPPGAVFGEQYIRIGARTMIGPHVTL